MNKVKPKFFSTSCSLIYKIGMGISILSIIGLGFVLHNKNFTLVVGGMELYTQISPDTGIHTYNHEFAHQVYKNKSIEEKEIAMNYLKNTKVSYETKYGDITWFDYIKKDFLDNSKLYQFEFMLIDKTDDEVFAYYCEIKSQDIENKVFEICKKNNSISGRDYK